MIPLPMSQPFLLSHVILQHIILQRINYVLIMFLLKHKYTRIIVIFYQLSVKCNSILPAVLDYLQHLSSSFWLEVSSSISVLKTRFGPKKTHTDSNWASFKSQVILYLGKRKTAILFELDFVQFCTGKQDTLRFRTWEVKAVPFKSFKSDSSC